VAVRVRAGCGKACDVDEGDARVDGDGSSDKAIATTNAVKMLRRAWKAHTAARGGMPMKGVALTSLWVAAARAFESEREGAWIHDPFARALAGPEGFDAYAKSRAVSPTEVPTIPVRTRWIDERVAEARARGVGQVVILAAGMDARAYRLDSLAGTAVFELDRDYVLSYKAERLGGAQPKARRTAIAIDLADDWPAALRAASFDPKAPAIWLVEGLTPYLHEDEVRALIARIDACSSAGSEILFDVLGQSVIASPFLARTLEAMKAMGAPWRFGSDDPETLFGAAWSVHVFDYAQVGHGYGRWPFPAVPRKAPGVPQSFLVRAVKG
jgi:methyltransferase (TIGR00027 family)